MPSEPPGDRVAEREELVAVAGDSMAGGSIGGEDGPEPSCYHALLTLATLQQCLALILFPVGCAAQIYALVVLWPRDQQTAWQYIAIILTPLLWGWFLVLAFIVSSFLRIVVDKGRRLRSHETNRRAEALDTLSGSRDDSACDGAIRG